jgi:hypothetical protein
MEKTIKEKKGRPIPVRLRPSTQEMLLKKSQEEDRSINYIIERSLRRELGIA